MAYLMKLKSWKILPVLASSTTLANSELQKFIQYQIDPTVVVALDCLVLETTHSLFVSFILLNQQLPSKTELAWAATIIIRQILHIIQHWYPKLLKILAKSAVELIGIVLHFLYRKTILPVHLKCETGNFFCTQKSILTQRFSEEMTDIC